MRPGDKIAVLDFGGQYAHLIANRIRRLGVFSEIIRPDEDARDLSGFAGVIFSGGPHSVYDPGRPPFNPAILHLGKPILGICYGHQLVCHELGGKVKPGKVREFGKSVLQYSSASPLFKGLGRGEVAWMSHGDSVARLPEGFKAIARTRDCQCAAVAHPGKRIFGVQFHPEVTHTRSGMKILDNFLSLCGVARNWSVREYRKRISEAVKLKTGKRNVFLLVSGGVDSTVVFALLNKVLGEKRVLGLHVDNGFMRLNETSDIEKFLARHRFHNMRVARAADTFLSRVKGIADPEKKRKIVGDTFIDVQRKELARLKLDPKKWILGQGTIYPDTIESGGTKHAAVIKTHHNRVPIIEKMIRQGRVIEPIADLYKDEVRDLGKALGMSDELVWRHPFPGPGLSVRTLCSDGIKSNIRQSAITSAKKAASKAGYTLVHLPIQSVGVQGDYRTYASPAAIAGPWNWERIADLSTDITNRIRAINRVVLKLGCNGPEPAILKKAFLTVDRLDLLRKADDICTRFLKEKKLYDKIWQMPVVLLPLGNAIYGESLVLRPVCSSEAMTADFYRMPFPALKILAKELLAIPGICAAYYDVTNKPPATIEWE